MSNNKCITVIGGVYIERCAWPHWDELYGSGGRALSVLQSLGCATKLYSCLNKDSANILQARAGIYKTSFEICSSLKESYRPIKFHYLHGLSTPQISAITTEFAQQNEIIEDNILVFGMLEGNPTISGNKVVYDPQNPISPKDFSENGSTANELAIVLNTNEAYKLIKNRNLSLDEIAYELIKNKAKVVIIKQGVRGVNIYQKLNDRYIKKDSVPCYFTKNVWKIGSGDCFSAHFAYQWIYEGKTPTEAAELASKATAYYCETRGYPSFEEFTNWKNRVQPITHRHSEKKVTVYLAGPFFTLSQIWLINETRRLLSEMGLIVFSPYHEIGTGDAIMVVPKDIDGINNSDIIFAIFDGKDSGTIFEIGYATAKNKPVIVYNENEKSEDLKMMEGTDCIVIKDYVSAIYRTLWESQKL
ncbi:PfkB family carbohydrate kinase [Aggregatibacter actinomycetemcomitans]|uniref:PfkB family carbohydrate kinase n=5 Tax=Aggregatibacter actinomycetemcomitans TaxID=714 RepID=UPI00022AE228|nr:PfkB family carbohydrate kinase [Aggregatibacter actinomycetemcomitans]AEW76472.1 nucleoside 2-deoxyribosyltransferase family protein [Aggregatibacter actinomycetemcomitans ANH9381]AMQ92945.1 nucleoside 2-deoxyribosyltransferase [Aggregatibacter actinomycetemcomitans]KND82363.1 nucleoside 2-deoxyribosyltransferase [Aggregatibacter actinomycetemcomitans serotype b str. SCC1398]KOE52611.1 nucleoside 2-deoxyribosyltransferase [Aggregatibacter actinomycetemcomitans serotype b str. SCC4092]TYA15